MSGWRLTYLCLLGLSLYVAFGGAVPHNTVAKDVAAFINHVAFW